jgi:hypothetical protein
VAGVEFEAALDPHAVDAGPPHDVAALGAGTVAGGEGRGQAQHRDPPDDGVEIDRPAGPRQVLAAAGMRQAEVVQDLRSRPQPVDAPVAGVVVAAREEMEAHVGEVRQRRRRRNQVAAAALRPRRTGEGRHVEDVGLEIDRCHVDRADQPAQFVVARVLGPVEVAGAMPDDGVACRGQRPLRTDLRRLPGETAARHGCPVPLFRRPADASRAVDTAPSALIDPVGAWSNVPGPDGTRSPQR